MPGKRKLPLYFCRITLAFRSLPPYASKTCARPRPIVAKLPGCPYRSLAPIAAALMLSLHSCCQFCTLPRCVYGDRQEPRNEKPSASFGNQALEKTYTG